MRSSFVCVGDVTQDNFFFINDASVHCDLNKENCELLLKYAQKIGVEEIGISVGGNAANVATGLSRLDLLTKFLTTFGDDDRGVWLKRELMRSGVDLDGSVADKNRSSNLSGIIVFQGERTILTYHCEGPDLVRELPESDWIYVSSSSGKDSADLHQKIVEHKKKYEKLKVAFNPSVSDLKRGSDFLKPILNVTEALIVNRVEAGVLLGVPTEKSWVSKVEEITEKSLEIAKIGPKIVAITDGHGGAYVFSGGKLIFCPVAPGFRVKETTGAGDAFSSGFLASIYLNGGDLEKAILWAEVNAGSVVSKIGGQAGLLSQKEIEDYLSSHQDFRAIPI